MIPKKCTFCVGWVRKFIFTYSKYICHRFNPTQSEIESNYIIYRYCQNELPNSTQDQNKLYYIYILYKDVRRDLLNS